MYCGRRTDVELPPVDDGPVAALLDPHLGAVLMDVGLPGHDLPAGG